MEPITIIAAVVALLVGGAGGYFSASGKKNALVEEMNAKADQEIKAARSTAKRIISEAESKAESISSKAESKNETIKQKKIAEAKEKFSKMRIDYETQKSERMVELKELEMNLKQEKKDFAALQDGFQSKIDDLDNREADIKSIRENLDKQLKIIAKKKEDLEQASEVHIKALEKVAKLSEADAKEQLLEVVKGKAETDAMAIIKDTITEAKQTANKEAKKIVIQTIQRMCAEYTIENTVSVFQLESDDIKGQIIGREGRNIRALEAATGAEIVVDDTPEAIIISSFDPIRREICRLALKRLVADGRIHPARIEEVVGKTKKELNEQIVEIGERAVIELDIHGLSAYMVKMVGRMRFRSSYGQNLLKHSKETANLCAAMAAELGLNPSQIKLAKRAGLLVRYQKKIANYRTLSSVWRFVKRMVKKKSSVMQSELTTTN
jgi:ribonuclease Y